MGLKVTPLQELPPRLPATWEEVSKGRVVLLNLNDRVDAYYQQLFSDAAFRRLLETTRNSNAVTGNVLLDEGRSADMVIAAAVKAGDHYVADHLPAAVVHALRVVRNRDGIGIRQRKKALREAKTAE